MYVVQKFQIVISNSCSLIVNEDTGRNRRDAGRPRRMLNGDDAVKAVKLMLEDSGG